MNLINNRWAFNCAADALWMADVIAIDIETTGGENGGLFVGDKITGFAVGTGDWTAYVPVRHVGSENLEWDLARELVLIVQEAETVLMHNSPYDRAGLALEFGIEFRDGQVYDTMTGDWICNENLHHGLKEIGARLFGTDAKAEKLALKATFAGVTVTDAYDDLRTEYLEERQLQRLDTGTPARLKAQAKEIAAASKRTWATVTAEDIAEYAEQDVRLTLDVYTWQQQFFADHPEYAPSVAREMRVDGCMYRLNMTGVAVDWVRVEAGYRVALAEAERLAAGFPDVNLRSVPQIRKLLYTQWKLPVRRFTKPGGDVPSTDKIALAGLAYDPRVATLIEFRKVAKIIDGYYLPMFLQRAEDDRIHPSFSSHRTVTGRASCSRPNLQTIPKEDDKVLDGAVDWKGELRAVFTAALGNVLYSSDLPNAELRVCAEISGEESWLETLRAGGDMHQLTADRSNLVRAAAKTLNFSALYGIGRGKLADNLGFQWGRRVPLSESGAMLRAFWAGVPRIERLFKALQETWVRRRRIPIRPWAGRFRHIDGKFGIPEVSYKALNSVIQGSIAEVVKDWLLELENRMPDGCRLVLMVHDSVVIEGPPGMLDKVSVVVQESFDKVNPFTELPWIIETKEGM